MSSAVEAIYSYFAGLFFSRNSASGKLFHLSRTRFGLLILLCIIIFSLVLKTSRIKDVALFQQEVFLGLFKAICSLHLSAEYSIVDFLATVSLLMLEVTLSL